jgi:hypothetical protein
MSLSSKVEEIEGQILPWHAAPTLAAAESIR